jgi:hypothetical protein
VLTDAYVRADVPDSLELRASAAGLVLRPHAVMVDRTAAWLWGVDTFDPAEVGTVPPLEVFVLRGHKRVRRSEAHGGARDLHAGDIVEMDGVRVTVPLRTAVDLARTRELLNDDDRDAVRRLAEVGRFDLDDCIAFLGRSRNLPAKRRALERLTGCLRSSRGGQLPLTRYTS